MILTNPHVQTRIEFIIYEDIYENNENLSQVTLVYGTCNVLVTISTSEN